MLTHLVFLPPFQSYLTYSSCSVYQIILYSLPNNISFDQTDFQTDLVPSEKKLTNFFSLSTLYFYVHFSHLNYFPLSSILVCYSFFASIYRDVNKCPKLEMSEIEPETPRNVRIPLNGFID